MANGAEVVAAGAVVSRKGPEVLLVHRPKYDDWSFPKGKLDPGEHETTAAVREVAEETGLDIRLGPPLTSQRYAIRNGETVVKRVHYWAGRAVGGNDVSSYKPNEEIDKVAWVGLDKAAKRLTYDRDRETLEEFRAFRKKTHPLVVLRHGKALLAQVLDRGRRPRASARRRRAAPGRGGRASPLRLRRPPRAELEQPPVLDDRGALRRRGRDRPPGDPRPLRGGRHPSHRHQARPPAAQQGRAGRDLHAPARPPPRVRRPRACATRSWTPEACSSCTTAAARSSPWSSTRSERRSPGGPKPTRPSFT